MSSQQREEIREKVVSLSRQGFSVQEIFEQTSVPTRSIYRYIQQAAQTIPQDDAPMSRIECNFAVDRELAALFWKGESTKYNCLGIIANYHSLDLSSKDNKGEAYRLLGNAIKRLQRRGEEFHIVPEFIANANNSEAMLQHFYDEAENLWHVLEQAIESIASSHYSSEHPHTAFQLRREMAKALCLPFSTKTAREQANTRHDSYWRVANICESNKKGVKLDSTFSIENTTEQLTMQQELIEQQVEQTVGITKDDIPY